MRREGPIRLLADPDYAVRAKLYGREAVPSACRSLSVFTTGPSRRFMPPRRCRARQGQWSRLPVTCDLPDCCWLGEGGSNGPGFHGQGGLLPGLLVVADPALRALGPAPQHGEGQRNRGQQEPRPMVGPGWRCGCDAVRYRGRESRRAHRGRLGARRRARIQCRAGAAGARRASRPLWSATFVTGLAVLDELVDHVTETASYAGTLHTTILSDPARVPDAPALRRELPSDQEIGHRR